MTPLEAIAPRLPPSLSTWPGYLLTFIAEHATERFERAVARHGIRSKHASVLVVIDAEGPMSQRALGRRLRIDKSPMVGLLDDLERIFDTLGVTALYITHDLAEAFARQLYNDVATQYNTKQKQIPTVFIASFAGASPVELWEISDEAERAVPKVELG